MIIHDSSLYKEATEKLLPHLEHGLTIDVHGGYGDTDGISVVCNTCHTIVMDFVAPPDLSDAAETKYEGHYDAARDVCHVEVFKPGRSPYPLQERQDIVDHSPCISWGDGGCGPAQCAFAILMDYLGNQAQALRLHQNFKFKVVARFPMNAEWILTGDQVEKALLDAG